MSHPVFAVALLLSAVLLVFLLPKVAADFYSDVKITWGDWRAAIFNNGQDLKLSMDYISGSGFESYDAFLFGMFSVQMQLIKGNSAGTVTTFYLSSMPPYQDEVDMEFLGNLEGHPYTLHTNLFLHGEGGREEQFHLWFDPTADFHNYTILWTPITTTWYVDGILIRIFMKGFDASLPYMEKLPMSLHGSMWNGESWATDGGRVKIDWSKAPFLAFYRNLDMVACLPSGNGYACGRNAAERIASHVNVQDLKNLKWVRTNHMTYTYCADPNRQAQHQDCPRELFDTTPTIVPTNV